MNIKPISKPYYKDDRPLLFKKRTYYGMGSYVERDIRKFKDKEYLISSNYINDGLLCTLIYVTKAGEWIKSKLKYFKDGRCYKTLISDKAQKVIWSDK